MRVGLNVANFAAPADPSGSAPNSPRWRGAPKTSGSSLIMLGVQVGPRAFVSMPRVRVADVTTDLTSLRAVLRELVPPEPQAVMDAGVLMLIATPVLTVGASAVAFARARICVNA